MRVRSWIAAGCLIVAATAAVAVQPSGSSGVALAAIGRL
jgi:hypothetical protein